MGNRYIISVTCLKCGQRDDDVYFAPTCGFTKWKCPRCGKKVNLIKYTGITKEEASNKEQIEIAMSKIEHRNI